MKYKAVATCGFGLESVVAFELRRAGVENIEVSDGRITFTADERGIAAANIWLRCAERVMIIVGEFDAVTFDELFDGVNAVNWRELVRRTDAFPVKGYCIDSQLSSVPACQSIVKKAIVENLKKGYATQFLTERGERQRIQFSLVRDHCTLMLDTSGDGLHKRGYRPLTTLAPIKETIAAGIADLARVRADSHFADPFCGSGTLLIEAALRAANIAPGLKRSFAFENFPFFSADLCAQVKAETAAQRLSAVDCAFSARGSDIDPQAIETSRRNAAAAQVADMCEFTVADVADFEPREDEIVVANPPYGERLMADGDIDSLYRVFAGRLNARPHRGSYVITNYPEFEHCVGRKADRRRKLYNGMINCQLYMYFK